MKRYLKLTAALLSCMLLFGCTSTQVTIGQSTVSHSGASDGVESASSAQSSEAEQKDSYKDIKPDTKLKIYTYTEEKGDSIKAAEKIFKELYGVPENTPEGYEADEDDVVVQIVPSEPLASIYYLLIFVQSGNPPDCYPASLFSYPYSFG